MTIKVEKRQIVPMPPPWDKEVSDVQGREYGDGMNFVVFDALVPALTKRFSIHVQPYTYFRGHRFAVDPECAPAFRILDIQLANVCTVLGGQGGAAATLFPPIPITLTDEERADYQALLSLNLSTASPSHRITITVENIAVHPMQFNGILWGRIPKQAY